MPTYNYDHIINPAYNYRMYIFINNRDDLNKIDGFLYDNQQRFRDAVGDVRMGEVKIYERYVFCSERWKYIFENIEKEEFL